MTVPSFIRAAGTWIRDATGSRLLYDNGVHSDATMGEVQARPASIGREDGFIEQVLASSLPTVTEDCASGAPWLRPGDAAHSTRAAIPVLDAVGKLKAVTVWSF